MHRQRLRLPDFGFALEFGELLQKTPPNIPLKKLNFSNIHKRVQWEEHQGIAQKGFCAVEAEEHLEYPENAGQGLFSSDVLGFV